MKNWLPGILLWLFGWSCLAEVTPASPNREILQLVAVEEFQQAAVVAAELVKEMEQGSAVPSADLAIAHHNLGYIYLKLSRYEEAEKYLNHSIELREKVDSAHSTTLVIALRSLADLYAKTDRHPEALDALRRAQHITHLNDGVFTLQQLPIVDKIIWLNIVGEQTQFADQQQRFYYLINENNYGEDDARLLPALLKLSDWYRKTAQFQEALVTYEKTIELVENQLGNSNVALLRPLRDMSSVLYLLGKCCPVEPLDRVVQILLDNPEVDVAEKLEAIMRLADMQTLAKGEQSAGQFYHRVWQMLKPGKAQEIFREPRRLGISRWNNVITAYRRAAESIPGHINRHRRLVSDDPMVAANPVIDLSTGNQRARKKRRNELIGSPLPLCFPQILHLMNGAEKDLASFYVSMEFNVDRDGRVSGIKVVDANAPPRVKGYVRHLLNLTRYRPRLDDGQPVLTERVSIRQTFESHEKHNTVDAIQDFSNVATFQGCQMLAAYI